MNLVMSDMMKSLKIHFSGLEDLGLLQVGRSTLPTLNSSDFKILESVANSDAKIPSTLENCVQCGRHRIRKNIVVGQIVANSQLCIIGSGPNETDDQSAKPYQGPRGALLDKMLSAINLQRHQISILYSIKCFSHHSSPAELQVEAETCSLHLISQLEKIGPKCILALGSSAAQFFCRSDAPLADLRLRDWQWQNTPVFVSHDPAALLENAGLKKEAWSDLQNLRKKLDQLL